MPAFEIRFKSSKSHLPTPWSLVGDGTRDLDNKIGRFEAPRHFTLAMYISHDRSRKEGHFKQFVIIQIVLYYYSLLLLLYHRSDNPFYTMGTYNEWV